MNDSVYDWFGIFGSFGLFLGYSLAALPLVIAFTGRVPRLFLLCLGIFLLGLTPATVLIEDLPAWLRHFLRCVLALGLPVCLLAACRPVSSHNYAAFLWPAFLILCVPTWLFSQQQVERFSQLAEFYQQQGRYRKALECIWIVYHIRGDDVTRMQSEELDKKVNELRRTVHSLSNPQTIHQRLQLAAALAMLDELPTALQTLFNVETPPAVRLKAQIYQKQEKWEASNTCYESLRGKDWNPAIEQGLAFNYRQQGRWREACKIYEKGLLEIPDKESQIAFQFMLAQTYAEAGQYTLAQQAFQTYQQLNPADTGSLQKFMEEARRFTPSCLGF